MNIYIYIYIYLHICKPISCYSPLLANVRQKKYASSSAARHLQRSGCIHLHGNLGPLGWKAIGNLHYLTPDPLYSWMVKIGLNI